LNKKSVKIKKGKVFVLSGPSGAGKTTLHKWLLKNKKIAKMLDELEIKYKKTKEI